MYNIIVLYKRVSIKHMYLLKLQALCLLVAMPFILLQLSSCHRLSAENASEQASQSADSTAVKCYKMQVDGQFQDYVKSMKSCDKMPADYQHRMIMMLRHHQKLILKEKQGVKSVKVLRTELNNNNRMANVFLNVCYKDGSTEEILCPMVLDNGRWRMQ